MFYHRHVCHDELSACYFLFLRRFFFRSLSVTRLVQLANRAVLLSGTPALSRPFELFSQLNALRPSMFGTLEQFGYQYCDARPSRFGGTTYQGAHKLAQLHAIVKKIVMIRRQKAVVLPSLGQLKRTIFSVDISDAGVMEHYESVRPLMDNLKRILLHERRKKVFKALFESPVDADADIFGAMSSSSSSESESEEERDGNRNSDELDTIPDDIATLTNLSKDARHSMMSLFSLSGRAKIPSVITIVNQLSEEKQTHAFSSSASPSFSPSVSSSSLSSLSSSSSAPPPSNPAPCLFPKKFIVFAHHRFILDELEAVLSKGKRNFIRIDGNTTPEGKSSTNMCALHYLFLWKGRHVILLCSIYGTYIFPRRAPTVCMQVPE